MTAPSVESSSEHAHRATHETPRFPQGLTARDIELVQKQCEIQGATSREQIEGFAAAYQEAKTLAQNDDRLRGLTSAEILEYILQLGALTERRNQKGFRTVEAHIGYNLALQSRLVPRAMEHFSRSYADFLQNPPTESATEGNPMAPTPTRLYTEFEKIHPFEDGNGRVGDLLWKLAMTRQTGTWPEELPPNVFSEKRDV